MRLRLAALAGTVLALSMFAAAADDDDPAPPEGVQVQARGPVHEAFAEAGDAVASPGAVVPKEPPAAIEEAPPEEKPEGDNIVWIPGYWGWDEEEAEFLWVSGFWRAEPPGREWVPGSWQGVRGGYAWTAGYWADERGAEETEYLPEPPESLERGPSVPAPAADYTYAPGIWTFTARRYTWRPGFWVRHRPNWVWVSDCHKWTPAGYVFVNGYWDAPLAERGLLFAPVRFTDRVFLRRDFVYRPAYVVQPDFLIGSLFVRRTTRAYHFGNYFEERHRKNYVSWVDHRVGGRDSYDANYAYYRQSFAARPGWERGVRALYAGRYSGEVARPPVTLVQQTKVLNEINVRKTTNVTVNKTVNITNVQNVTALAPVRKASAVRVTGLARLSGTEASTDEKVKTIRVAKASAESVKEVRRQTERYKAVSVERRTAETKAATTRVTDGAKDKDREPLRLKREVPKATAPPRKTTAPAPPPPPVRPKASEKEPPRKDRDPPPTPKDRDRDPPRKDKDKAPTPKDRDRDPPRKDKDKTPPPKDRDREPPRKDRDVTPKDRDKTPPPPVDKDVPPPKGKEKPPPPKEKPAPPPPPKEKPAPPPPPKEKPAPPPPPKEKPAPPPPPKEKPPTPPPPPKAAPPKPPTPPPPPPKDKDRPGKD